MKNKRQHNILILSGLLVLSGCSVSNARSQSSDNGIDIESWGRKKISALIMNFWRNMNELWRICHIHGRLYGAGCNDLMIYVIILIYEGDYMKDTKIQWHPGFVAAMNLEFAKDRESLIFEKEYNLNTKPLEIDLLVIKKEATVRIDNEIGSLFRGHNIMEYKSPEDALDIDDFYKTGAYASLYKAYGETTDAVRADDVTVSLVREAKPEGLFRYFREHGYRVSSPYSGIYYIEDKVLFPTQIVVTGELDEISHIWLGALTGRMQKQGMVKLLEQVERLSEKADKEFADSVLEVSIGANKKVVEELIGDGSMCQALMEIMEPQLLLREKEGIKEGIKKGIQGTVDTLKEFGHGEPEIKKAIMNRYALSEEEAEGYLRRY